jgi:hypothetical protein
MEPEELVQRLRVQRLTTLSLADQIKEDRWHEPALPGGRSIHDLLAHLLAWDEWAVAVFELSQLRETLPPALMRPAADRDAYNAKAVARYQGISRDDLLSALQAASPRVLQSAAAGRGPDWLTRRIAGLQPWPPASASTATVPPAAEQPPSSTQPPRAPSVRSILRLLATHEAEHDQEIMQAYGIQPQLDQFKPQGGEQSGA